MSRESAVLHHAEPAGLLISPDAVEFVETGTATRTSAMSCREIATAGPGGPGGLVILSQSARATFRSRTLRLADANLIVAELNGRP